MYKKLVRDNIPNIIEQKGEKPVTRILDDEEYKKLLDEKLIEEVNEYINSDEVEELADIVEVIYAILDYKEVKLENFEKIRLSKKEKRGGFKNKIFLEEVK